MNGEVRVLGHRDERHAGGREGYSGSGLGEAAGQAGAMQGNVLSAQPPGLTDRAPRTTLPAPAPPPVGPPRGPPRPQ